MLRTSVIVTFAVGFALAGSVVRSEVVVIANRADGAVSFELTPVAPSGQTSSPPVPSRHVLALGDLHAAHGSQELRIAFASAGQRKEYLLEPNSAYFFARDDQGQLGLRKIDLGDIGAPSARATPSPTKGAGANAAEPPLRNIQVKILVDDDERSLPQAWQTRLRDRVAKASAVLERVCRVRLSVTAAETWLSSPAAADFVSLRQEFERVVQPAPAEVAIGFTRQLSRQTYAPADAPPLHRHIVLPEDVPQRTEAEAVEILLHELGHFLGAVHSPESNSAMRKGLPDGQARLRGFTPRFDPVNVLAMNLMADEIGARGVKRLEDLSPRTAAHLRQIYSVMDASNPEDPNARIQLAYLDAAVRDALAEAPGALPQSSPAPLPKEMKPPDSSSPKVAGPGKTPAEPSVAATGPSPVIQEITVPNFPGGYAIWGATGGDHRGHVWFGVSATGVDTPSARLFEFIPRTGQVIDRGNVVDELKRLKLWRPGEGQMKIHSKIVQAADGKLYFASMDEQGEHEDGSQLPRWGSHFWRLDPADGRWERLFATRHALIAVSGAGRYVYALGYFGHQLYQYDTQTGKVQTRQIGAPGGHISRNFLTDRRGHVFVPRVKVDNGASDLLKVSLRAAPAGTVCTLVELDPTLREVGETPLEDYMRPGVFDSSEHGLTGVAELPGGDLLFTTHHGRLYRITPAPQGAAQVRSLGWFYPGGTAYAPSLFVLDDGQTVAGVVKPPRSDFAWRQVDLKTGRGTMAPLFPPGAALANRSDLLLYGSMTRDDVGRPYLVGRMVRERQERPLLLQLSLPSSDRASAKPALAANDRPYVAPSSPTRRGAVDVRNLQAQAMAAKQASWGRWGPDPRRYSSWSDHSNRLVPVYTFGLALNEARKENAYHNADRLRRLYGQIPVGSLNPQAEYFDQTALYELQKQAYRAGKKYVILMVFDGMDWQTTAAAAHYRSRRIYREGPGEGLFFQDYRGVKSDYGFVVSSPYSNSAEFDVNAQTANADRGGARGGYSAIFGGGTPWAVPADPRYLLGNNRQSPHAVTDSSSAATSMTSGIKTYNAAVNVGPDGAQATPLARELQTTRGIAVGVVTSVPISHATPAAAYANNVDREDYQDLSRDLLGLPSIAHRDKPLKGVDVLLGCGWGVTEAQDLAQGVNYLPGNRYLASEDRQRIDAAHGGPYLVVERTAGENGAQLLAAAAKQAVRQRKRLFGFFGAAGGHLPFQTADGRYDPAPGLGSAEQYTSADIEENPTLADMTRAALTVLEQDPEGFWLMIESGDVDFANHDNNLDNSIGAVLSGEAAFQAVVQWIEAHNIWSKTAVIVTADHGHYLVLDRPEMLTGESSNP